MSPAETELLEILGDNNLEVRSYDGVTIGRDKFTVASKGARGGWVSQQGSSHLKADFVRSFLSGKKTVKERRTRYGLLTNVLEVGANKTVLLDVIWYKFEAAYENRATKNIYLRRHGALGAVSEPRLVEACSISNLVVITPLRRHDPGFDAFLQRKSVIFDRDYIYGIPLFERLEAT